MKAMREKRFPPHIYVPSPRSCADCGTAMKPLSEGTVRKGGGSPLCISCGMRAAWQREGFVANMKAVVRVTMDITIHRVAGDTETPADAFSTALWATQKDVSADVAEVIKARILADYPTTTTLVEAKRTASKVLSSTVEFKP